MPTLTMTQGELQLALEHAAIAHHDYVNGLACQESKDSENANWASWYASWITHQIMLRDSAVDALQRSGTLTLGDL